MKICQFFANAFFEAEQKKDFDIIRKFRRNKTTKTSIEVKMKWCRELQSNDKRAGATEGQKSCVS